jgi:hypothetical protein
MVDQLIKAGWTQTGPIHRGAEATFVFEQKGDDGLILEERGDGLWLWIEGTGDRRVFGLEPTGDSLDAVLKALIAMQSKLTVATHLEYYGVLGKLCPTSIVAWEQFADAPDSAAAGAPATAPSAGGGGDDDPIVFPNGPLKRLSDYVAVMRGLQGGDFQGTLAKFGLDMMSYAEVATAWGQKFATDPALALKMGKMMMG